MSHKFCPVSGGFGQIVVTHRKLSHPKIILVGISPSFRIPVGEISDSAPKSASSFRPFGWPNFVMCVSFAGEDFSGLYPHIAGEKKS